MAIHHFQMITITIFESSYNHNMCEAFATCECATHWTQDMCIMRQHFIGHGFNNNPCTCCDDAITMFMCFDACNLPTRLRSMFTLTCTFIFLGFECINIFKRCWKALYILWIHVLFDYLLVRLLFHRGKKKKTTCFQFHNFRIQVKHS